MTRATPIATLFACSLATGCKGGGDGPEDGTLDIRIYGGDYIEEGIPADKFSDGWEVSWDTFIVALDSVATTADEDETRYLFDLTAVSGGAGNKVARLRSPSGMPKLGYRISYGPAATEGNATAETVTTFVENEWSIYVEGSAVKDAVNLTFAWGFTTKTTYEECEVAEMLPESGEVRTLITIRAQQMFQDKVGEEGADVRFDSIAAADADMDTIVTPSELQAVEFGTLVGYDAGDAEVTNLFEMVKAQVARLGHIDGDGRCTTD